MDFTMPCSKNRVGNRHVAKHLWQRYWQWGIGLFLSYWLVIAHAADNGGISFRNFSIENADSPQHLVSNVQLDYQLNDYLREGLLNGMTLESEIRFTLEWHNSWWWNTQRHLLSVKSELKYHPLSKQYQLLRLDSQETQSFSTLIAALEYLGRLQNQPLPALPDNAYHNNAALFVSATLAPKTMQLPLKIQALFNDKYTLESEGVMWPIP